MYTTEVRQFVADAHQALLEQGSPICPEDKAPVILFGPTGSGKSTLTNYLLGVRYQVEGDVLTPVEGEERAAVGHSTVDSQTLFPATFELNDHLLCDLPGFQDTRSDGQRLASITAVQRLINSSSKPLKIAFIIDAHAFESGRMGAMINYLNMLNVITNGLDEDKLKGVLFVLTKVPTGLDPDYFINEYFNPKKDSLESRDGNLSESEQVTLTVCRFLQSNQSNLVCADISDTHSRRQLVDKLDSMPALDASMVSFAGVEANLLQALKDGAQQWQDHRASLDYNIASARALQNEIANLEAAADHTKTENIKRSTQLADLTKQSEELTTKIARLETDRATVDTNIKQLRQTKCTDEQELNLLASQVSPSRIRSYHFSAASQTEEYEKGKNSKRRYSIGFMRVGPRDPIMAIRKKQGSGSYTFTHNGDVQVLSARCNADEVPPDNITDCSVSYVHTYSLGDGTNAVFDVFVRERDLPENREAMAKHQAAVEEKASEIKKQQDYRNDLDAGLHKAKRQLAEVEDRIVKLRSVDNSNDQPRQDDIALLRQQLDTCRTAIDEEHQTLLDSTQAHHQAVAILADLGFVPDHTATESSGLPWATAFNEETRSPEPTKDHESSL